jgi:hypothetical protein
VQPFDDSVKLWYALFKFREVSAHDLLNNRDKLAQELFQGAGFPVWHPADQFIQVIASSRFRLD